MEELPTANEEHLFLDSPIPPIKLPLDYSTHKLTNTVKGNEHSKVKQFYQGRKKGFVINE